MSEDITDEERALEQRLRDKWQRTDAATGKGKITAPVEYHFYTRELPDGRGGVDTYWRLDRIEGSESFIHREFNSKMLATIEVDKLRKAGFTVHAIQTSAELTLEAIEHRQQEVRQILDESKNTTEIIERFIAAGRNSNK